MEKFVECKLVPGIRPWGPGSMIHFECSCGKVMSYDSPDKRQHWKKFEFKGRKASNESWENFFKRAQNHVKENPSKYSVPDWTE